MKRLLSLLFFSPLVVIVLPTLLCVSWWGGNVLYGNWVEYKRISNLTQKYGDELFETVKNFESRYTLSGYVDKDKFCQYVINTRLEECKTAWDAIHNGEREAVRVATKLDSPQVVLYTGNTAELVVEVHEKKIRYGPDGPEIIDPSDWAMMAVYYLQLEDDVWKVALIDTCGLSDERCIRYMKRIEERWYHID